MQDKPVTTEQAKPTSEVVVEPEPCTKPETFRIVEQQIDSNRYTIYEVGFPTRGAAEKVVKDYYRAKP